MKVLPISRLTQVLIKVEGPRTYIEFKVIDIVDDTKPYPTILGIDWAINNQAITNFKKRILLFEYWEMRLVPPINPLEGRQYDEPVKIQYR